MTTLMSDVQPEFDTDGYPTEGTLDRIRQWSGADLEGVLHFVAAAWRYPEYACEVRPGIWTFATGGWWLALASEPQGRPGYT